MLEDREKLPLCDGEIIKVLHVNFHDSRNCYLI